MLLFIFRQSVVLSKGRETHIKVGGKKNSSIIISRMIPDEACYEEMMTPLLTPASDSQGFSTMYLTTDVLKSFLLLSCTFFSFFS